MDHTPPPGTPIQGVPYPFIPPEKTRAHKTWGYVGVILAALVASGTVASVLGKAFYVSREEYTESEKRNITRDNAIERLNTTLNQQRASFDRVVEELQAMKMDLALIKAKTRRGGN
jgi:CTP-dependent riboflavin kinase